MKETAKEIEIEIEESIKNKDYWVIVPFDCKCAKFFAKECDYANWIVKASKFKLKKAKRGKR